MSLTINVPQLNNTTMKTLINKATELFEVESLNHDVYSSREVNEIIQELRTKVIDLLTTVDIDNNRLNDSTVLNIVRVCEEVHNREIERIQKLIGEIINEFDIEDICEPRLEEDNKGAYRISIDWDTKELEGEVEECFENEDWYPKPPYNSGFVSTAMKAINQFK